MAYCEPLSRSCFSLLQGASTPEQLIEAASVLGISALGIADRDAVYGLVRAHKAARASGVQLLCGATITVAQHPPLTLLVETLQGWQNLCHLLTQARSEENKGYAVSKLDSIVQHSEGLSALFHFGWNAVECAPLSEVFSGRAGVLLTRRFSPRDTLWARWATALSDELKWPLIASSDVLAHAKSHKAVADVLACIRLGLTLEEAGQRLGINDERSLRSEQAFRDCFSAYPQAVENGLILAERCTFSLDALRYHYPREVVPDDETPMKWLTHLVHEGLSRRYPSGVSDKVWGLIHHELALIEKLNFAHYFLTVYDIVRFARSRGILCQGRGSAANSAVCYALGITAVDPSCAELLFERFISEERNEPPDIDVDFEHERREEVIQYIYERYGRHRAALINEFITYRFRSAIRDVGKVFGLSLDQVDRLAKTAHGWGRNWDDEQLVQEAGLDPTDWGVQQAVSMSHALKGIPRHLSIHVGGFVISDGSLMDLVPVEPAKMVDRTVIQWDKDDVDALGFVKVDVLGLGMLTAIRKSFDLIASVGGPEFSLATVPSEDSLVYDMFCRADTIGVFQIESRAQMSMLPRLRPRCFYDLVIEVSIVRPGPIQGGMVHPYLRRRHGLEPIHYAHPKLKPVLERTLGVPLFQEQVMQMAVTVGGFTAGEADALRRAMGAWRKRGTLHGLGRKLVSAMLENGLSKEYAESIFEQIKGFGEYGFPESHAASFALLVYVSGWLKCHYPAAFAAALINSQPMGFYSARSIVADVESHGVAVRPVCVQFSAWECSLELGAAGQSEVRLGFCLLKGIRLADAEQILEVRARAPFTDLRDFMSRTGVTRSVMERLAEANAFSVLVADRRQALWEIQGQWAQLPLFQSLSRREPRPKFPMEHPLKAMDKDSRTVGLSIGQHPMQRVRAYLGGGVRCLSALYQLKNGQHVTVAGLVINRQRPQTAQGVIFMTLEDESALVNVVVWPALWEKQRILAQKSNLLGVHGVLQKEGRAISILARKFWPIKLDNFEFYSPARNFR